jgi:hypothetical protein
MIKNHYSQLYFRPKKKLFKRVEQKDLPLPPYYFARKWTGKDPGAKIG